MLAPRRTAASGDRLYGVTVAGLLVLLGVVVFANGYGHFFTDIKPEVYIAPWSMVHSYLSSWTQSPYLGAPNFNVGLVPVLAVLSPLRAIGLSPGTSYRIFHFLLWALTAWGAARLLRALTPRADRWAALLAGVLYVANPYTVQAGSTLAIALPMAWLPWMLLAFVRAVHAPRSWKWPAVFGLAFFAMSGMNVGVVPVLQLLALVPLMIFARRGWGIPWRDLLRVLARCALFVVGLSIYWLVPAAAALSTGSQIVGSSETITGIAKVSSFPEVLRGMGLWPLYGHDANGPWESEYSAYITSPYIIVLTVLWPVLGLLALRWCRGVLRGLVIGLVAVAAVVMVGAFPSESSPASPFGRVLVAFLHLPGMAAFRTTNKIGALLALAFALSLGLAGRTLRRRFGQVDPWGPLAALLSVIVVSAWVSPALTNRLYLSPMDIPDYWHQAASTIDKGNRDASVLFLPGQTRPSYRWTVQRPDDVANSLFRRNVVIPETTPNASAPGANYLTALDDTLQNGVVPASAMSTYARYLGADTILLRHDVNWEDAGGVRPAVSSKVLATDPGLFGASNYGLDGEYTMAPGQNPLGNGEDDLPPLQQYDVVSPLTSLRAERTSSSVLVAGDGASVASMADAGLLRSTPSFQYVRDVDTAGLANQLGGSHGLVITDTNARRAAITNRLSNGRGPLLPADQTPESTNALGNDPADQTVLVASGAQVTATAQGGTFFDLPYATPQNALDGNPATSWLFGDFNRAKGQSLTITEPAPVALGTVRIQQASVGRAKIDRLTVTAGGRSVTRRMPDTGYASFPMGSAPAASIKVTVGSQRGGGYNLVGLSDIRMPGPLAVRAARTPTTFSTRYAQLSAADRARFDATPLSVLLTRAQGTPSTGDDEETGLRRIVSLPDQRTFRSTASVRIDGPMEPVYDRVAGYSPAVQATSKRFYFDDPKYRASAAADGSDATAWVPGDGVPGAWWQIAGSRRSIDQVTVTQRAGVNDKTTSASRTQWAQQAVVTVDGRQVGTGSVRPDGTTTLSFPAVIGRTVRVTFTKAANPARGVPARFTSIDAGLQVQRTSAGPQDQVGGTGPRCLTVATVDGAPVRMRPDTTTLARSQDRGTTWTGCGSTTMQSGSRRIEQATGFTVDSMALRDTRARPAIVPAAPVVTKVSDGAAHKSLRVRSAGAFAVVTGQSYDTRWHATANGKDLGRPVVLDGYATGWKVPSGGTYDIQIRYAPQRASNVALAVSLAVLLAAVILATGVGRRVVRRRPGRTDPMPQGAAEVGAGTGAETGVEVPAGRPHDVRNLVLPRVRSGRSRTSRATRPAGPWPPPLPRIGVEIALVVAGGFFLGWAGLVAAALIVAVLRWRPVPSQWLVGAGSALIAASVLLYVVLLSVNDLVGEVSADAVATSLWPHYLGAAGLLIALVGGLRDYLLAPAARRGSDADSDAGSHSVPDHERHLEYAGDQSRPRS